MTRGGTKTASTQTAAAAAAHSVEQAHNDSIVSGLIKQRQNIPTADTATRKAISKAIRQQLRRQKRADRRDRINTILEQYK
eukprot:4081909-Pyramimonas_sp.AAC.1